MDNKLARTWEIPGAVLGCLFTPDIFSGTPTASVVFWFSLPGTQGTLALLRAAIRAAKESGCKRISIADYYLIDGPPTGVIYRRLGFRGTEKTFQKEL